MIAIASICTKCVLFSDKLHKSVFRNVLEMIDLGPAGHLIDVWLLLLSQNPLVMQLVIGLLSRSQCAYRFWV